MLAREREDRIGIARETVADERLLRQPEDDEHQAAPEALLPAFAEGAHLELVHDLRPAHQGAGQHLRKEGDVEPVAGQAVERRDAGAEIGEIHDMMKGEEGNAERQREARLGQVKAAQGVGQGREEARIFEHAEDREIGGDRGRDQERKPMLSEKAREGPIHEDRGRHQRHEAPIPIAVEDEREREQRLQADAGHEALRERLDRERGRQEDEEEREGVEQHGPRGRV